MNVPDKVKVENWMYTEKEEYLKECEDQQDALNYLVMDANGECGTNLSEEELTKIAKEVLGLT